MKLTRTLLVSLLAPGVVFLLVAIQVAFGLRGFDLPRGGLTAILEVPGLLVGWGSLAFLIPVLTWLVLDWWGVSASGLAIKCLGAATLALSLGAVFGLFGGLALGGHLGTSLAQLLEGALGRAPAIGMLVLMGVPGAVLAGAGFLELRGGSAAAARARQKDRKPKRAKQTPTAAKTGAKPKSSGTSILTRVARAFAKPKKRVSNLADLVREDAAAPTHNEGEAWYPERRFDESGNELPMEFGRARDVGGIRFTGEEEQQAPEPADTTFDAASVDLADADLPVEGALADAIEHASAALAPELETRELETRELEEGGSEDEPATTPATEAEAPSTPLLPTIPELFAEPEAEIRLEDGTHTAASDGAREDATAEGGSLGRLVGKRDREAENRLPSGVRWADDPTPASRQLWAPDKELDGADEEEEEATEPAAIDAATDDDHAGVGDAGVGDAGVGHVDAEDRGYALTERAEALREQLPPDAEALGEALSQRASPVEPVDVAETPSVRDSVLQALSGDAQSKSSKRYLEKLEASGIFDFMDEGGSAADESPVEASEQAAASKTPAGNRAAAKKAAKKKAAKKGPRTPAASQKAPAKKKAAKKKAAKASTTRPATGNATKRKKNAAKGKKTAAQSKKSAIRPPAKAAKTRAPASKRSEPKPKLAVSAPRKKTAARPWKSGDWDPTQQIKQPPQALLTTTQREQLLRAVAQPTFRQAAEVAIQRGAAAPMLFTRRLGVSPHEARALVQRLVQVGILDVATASGAHPARLTPEHWADMLQA